MKLLVSEILVLVSEILVLGSGFGVYASGVLVLEFFAFWSFCIMILKFLYFEFMPFEFMLSYDVFEALFLDFGLLDDSS